MSETVYGQTSAHCFILKGHGFLNFLENLLTLDRALGLYCNYMDDVWYDKWTKGFVLNLHRMTASAYSIREIDGSDCLFMEWKMGNYVYGGYAPDYYAFVRANGKS